MKGKSATHRKRAILVANTTPPGDEEDRRIGERIRALRKGRSLTIEQLAGASSLSVGMLSQLERGLTTPSVRSLRVLGAALGVSISWFFTQGHINDPVEARHVVRRPSRPALTLTQSGIHKELLTPESAGLIELYELTVKPGGTSGPEFYSHKGEKAGTVLSGSLELWLGERSTRLNEGDSFRFPSSLAHRFENRGTVPTRVIWIVAGSGGKGS